MSPSKKDGDNETQSQTPDLFRLSEVVEHRVDPEAEHVFDDCESLVKAYALQDPFIKQRFLNEERIELPVYQKDKNHRYQLERMVDSMGVTFTYRRLGIGYEKSGFRLTQMLFSPAILSTLDADDPIADDQAGYTEMIAEAKKQLNAYAKALNVAPKTLSEYKSIEIVPESRKKRIAQGVARVLSWPFTAPYYQDKKGEMLRSKYFADGRVERVPGRRHASIARLSLIALLAPVPPYSSDVHLGSLSIPKPAVIEVIDDLVNMSEHKRQGFDAIGLQIPTSSGIVVSQQASVILKETPPLPSDIAAKLTNAPTLNAEEGSTQDLYGGPRRLRNLGTDSSFTDNASDLDKGQCTDIKVNMRGGDRLLVANVGANLSQLVSIELLRNKIIICNNSDDRVDEVYLDNIYVQVVPADK